MKLSARFAKVRKWCISACKTVVFRKGGVALPSMSVGKMQRGGEGKKERHETSETGAEELLLWGGGERGS